MTTNELIPFWGCLIIANCGNNPNAYWLWLGFAILIALIGIGREIGNSK